MIIFEREEMIVCLAGSSSARRVEGYEVKCTYRMEQTNSISLQINTHVQGEGLEEALNTVLPSSPGDGN